MAIVLAIPILITAGTWYLVEASTKSYRFPQVTIDATVNQDGSLDLVERRTFEFDGSFGFAFFTVAWPEHRIQGFRVAEDGRPFDLETDAAGGFRARWEFSAKDEQRTFTIRYRALCAVNVWEDTAHLLWQFVGTGWEVPTDSLTVRVHVPGRAAGRVQPLLTCDQRGGQAVPTRPLSPGDVRAWGHGPLQGQVDITDPQTVELRVADVPPYTFVEGSILFPRASVPLAPSTGIDKRADILAEERALAEAANAQRRIFLAEEARRTRLSRVTWGLLVGLPLLMAALVLISALRERVPGVPRLLRDPPEEIHPVRLAHMWALYRGRSSQRTAYRTQLLHLAQEGVIDVQPVGAVTDPDDFTIRLVRRPPKGGLDVDFVDFLFPDSSGEVSLKRLKATGKRRVPLNDWWEAVSDKARNGLAPMMRHGGRPESVLAVLAGIGAALWGIAGASLIGRPFSLWLIPLGIGSMIIALVKIPPRFGPEFLERMARWRAFRRFLTEFSSLDEAPALAVVIWERYLVLATALGVAEEVEDQVTAIVPVEELPPPWQGAPGGVPGVAWLGSFNTPVPVSAVAASASSSSWSSSSGSSFSSPGGFGGGFSGGGGFGGGGTGGGAG